MARDGECAARRNGGSAISPPFGDAAGWGFLRRFGWMAEAPWGSASPTRGMDGAPARSEPAPAVSDLRAGLLGERGARQAPTVGVYWFLKIGWRAACAR